MNTKATHITLLALILGVFACGVYFYPQLPDQIASHWNAAGDVDSYMDKFWGVFLIPALMSAFYALFTMIPPIDPLRKNFKDFMHEYNLLWMSLMAFFAYVFVLQVAWNLDIRFDFGKAIILAMAFLFFVIGSVIAKAKRNWFVGIRTPWTLSSDKVWDSTHSLGGKLFKVVSVIILIGIFLPTDWMIASTIAPITLGSLYLVFYSYLQHKKLK